MKLMQPSKVTDPNQKCDAGDDDDDDDDDDADDGSHDPNVSTMICRWHNK